MTKKIKLISLMLTIMAFTFLPIEDYNVYYNIIPILLISSLATAVQEDRKNLLKGTINISIDLTLWIPMVVLGLIIDRKNTASKLRRILKTHGVLGIILYVFNAMIFLMVAILVAAKTTLFIKSFI